ncbi:MAG: hypothetical protein WEF53_02030 [Bacteroidota bacterium]
MEKGKDRLKQISAAVIAASALCSVPALAQAPAVFDKCSEVRSVIFVRGDVLQVACDTVYVLNALTFRRYDSAYKDLRKRSPSITNLMASYDEIIALQDRRLMAQQTSYDELRLNFDNLAGTTSKTIEGSATRLTFAMSSMDSLKSEMTETRRLLSETQSILEAEKRGIDLGKVLWGAGGLATGLIVGIILSK